jgi:hypothetical protein
LLTGGAKEMTSCLLRGFPAAVHGKLDGIRMERVCAASDQLV